MTTYTVTFERIGRNHNVDPPAMLDVTVRRESTRLLRLLDEHHAITAELCLRGQVADGAADLETYLSEETRER